MKIARLLLLLPVMFAYTASAQNLRDALNKVTEDYHSMRKAVDAGNVTKVTEASQGFIWDARGMRASEMSDEQRRQWIGHLDKLMMACRGISQGRNLDAQKQQFSELSKQFFQTLRLFNLNKQPIYKLSCNGNVWLTQTATVSNPYVAKADKSKKCGNIDDILNPRK